MSQEKQSVWLWRKEIVRRVSPYESFIVFFSFACLFVWSKVEKVLACTYKWLRKILQFVSQLWVWMSFSNHLSKVQLNMRLPLHVEVPLNLLFVSLLLLHGQSIFLFLTLSKEYNSWVWNDSIVHENLCARLKQLPSSTLFYILSCFIYTW